MRFESNPEFCTPETAEARKKWADALRSGKYKQTTGLMYHRNSHAFCCLGVAEVAGGVCPNQLHLAGGIPTREKIPNSWLAYQFGWDGDNEASPSIATIKGQPRAVKAYRLNDVYRLGFAQIADLIEGKAVET